MRMTRSPVERVIARIVVQDDCWVYDGTLNPEGYGLVVVGKRRLMAHNVVYEALRGPMPPGMLPDHLCRNHACVNPAHIEPVTTRENILRGTSPSALNARKTHCKHGHELAAGNLHVSPRGHRTCRACSRRNQHRYRQRKGVA